MTARSPNASAATWIWALLSVAAWIASFIAAFGAMAALGTLGWIGPDFGGVRHDLALLLALHGILAAAGVLGASRLVFERWSVVRIADGIILLVGLCLAVAIELVLHEWLEVRYRSNDTWDIVGPTALLSIDVVAVAVSTFAVRVAPHGSALPALLAQVMASVLVGLIVLSNVGGVLDGVEPESWALAVLVGLSAVYATAVVLIGVRRVARG